jgi:hypothetical protein
MSENRYFRSDSDMDSFSSGSDYLGNPSVTWMIKGGKSVNPCSQKVSIAGALPNLDLKAWDA